MIEVSPSQGRQSSSDLDELYVRKGEGSGKTGGRRKKEPFPHATLHILYTEHSAENLQQ